MCGKLVKFVALRLVMNRKLLAPKTPGVLCLPKQRDSSASVPERHVQGKP